MVRAPVGGVPAASACLTGMESPRAVWLPRLRCRLFEGRVAGTERCRRDGLADGIESVHWIEPE